MRHCQGSPQRTFLEMQQREPRSDRTGPDKRSI